MLFYDAGQVRDFGESFGWKEDLTRIVVAASAAAGRSVRDLVAARSECAGRHDRSDRADERVQDLDRRRAALLHAGAERAVPADLRVQPVSAPACSTTICSRRRRRRSGSRSERRSRRCGRGHGAGAKRCDCRSSLHVSEVGDVDLVVGRGRELADVVDADAELAGLLRRADHGGVQRRGVVGEDDLTRPAPFQVPRLRPTVSGVVGRRAR